jgi:hypothetical protein
MSILKDVFYIENLLCIICYPENQKVIENQAFTEFWKCVIKPRSVKIIFATNTVQVFEKLKHCNQSSTAIYLLSN